MNQTRMRLGSLVGGLILAALFGGPIALWPGTIHAQTPETGVTSKDPSTIVFTVRATVPSGLKSARLDYAVSNPNGDVGGTGEGTVTPGTPADASFSLQANGGQRYIPVGSLIKYHWILEGTNGASITTPTQEYLFLDGRYEWRSRTDGIATVYWYGPDETRPTGVLRAAKEALTQTGELLKVSVDYKIRLMVWRSEDEGRLAKRPTSPTFDAQIQTGGQRVAPDVVFVFANDLDVVRHEVAHIVTHVAGTGAFGSIPSWLDEGTAVFVQESPGPGYSGDLQGAIRADRTLVLRSIQAPVGQAQLVNVFYGQSWSTVKFMVDEFGREKFAELYRVVKSGARIDDALQQVYKLDQDSLYNAWRQKNGLKPVAAAQIVSPNVPTSQATQPPLGIPQGGGTFSGPTPEASGEGAPTASGAGAASSGPSRTMAYAVLGGTVVLAAALGGGGFMLLRGRKSE